jgi:hypothetical protein
MCVYIACMYAACVADLRHPARKAPLTIFWLAMQMFTHGRKPRPSHSSVLLLMATVIRASFVPDCLEALTWTVRHCVFFKHAALIVAFVAILP